MKAFNKAVVLVLLSMFLGFNFAFANDIENPADTKEVARIENSAIAYSLYSVRNASKIRFAFEKVTSGSVTVKIYDDELNLIHKDVRDDAVSAKISYDLAAIGIGTYRVKVSSGKFVKNHTFKVGYTDSADFSAYISSKVVDNKVRIAFQNAVAPVGITITDADGITYHDQIVTGKSELTNLLNLSQLPEGEYNIAISCDGKSSKQTVTVE